MNVLRWLEQLTRGFLGYSGEGTSPDRYLILRRNIIILMLVVTLVPLSFMAAVNLPEADPNRVVEVTFKENELTGVRGDKSTFKTFGPNDTEMRKTLESKGVRVNFEPPEEMSWWKTLLINSLPLVIILFLFIFFGGRIMIT